MKRLFDLMVVAGTLPLWAPLMVVVGGLVRLRLGGPILFRQARPGRGGVVFELIKFRSMTDQQDRAGRLLADSERLTPFGRFLRSTSLDELPELWNVVRGEMSLVGPRPLLVSYLPRYSVEQARRHEVLPGITGLAQIKGRNGIDWDAKFRWDVYYVDNHTLFMDIKILFITAWKVVRRDGISSDGQATTQEFKP
jgi:sugar transferase EpsL